MGQFKEENKKPDDEDEYDDEAGDEIQDLQAEDGVGVLNQHKASANEEMPKDEVPFGKHHPPYPSGKPHSGLMKQSSGINVKYDPVAWDQFYDSMEMLNDVVPIYYAGTKGHVFLCLHGAGHSAQSFAALAKIMKGQSTVVSFDFRGHGGHYREDETEMS